MSNAGTVLANSAIAGKYRDLQRVTVPYAKLLGVVDGEEGEGDAMET